MEPQPLHLGIVGTGNILPQYLSTLLGARGVKLVALADLDVERAKAAGAAHGLPGMSPEELMALPDLDVLVNLTVPAAHAPVSQAALERGLHVYSEKPLALTRSDGLALLRLAEERGLQLACGPDTFMGSAFAKAQELLSGGAIGTVIGASASFSGHGPEAWHPNPAFFYQPGAGPLFDLGPYYLTHLVKLLGPVARVSGSARIGSSERIVASGPLAGQVFPVGTPTTVNALLEFAAGPIATFSCSFDVWASDRPFIELHGSDGTLQLADPNTFAGTLRMFQAGAGEWHEETTSQAIGQGRGTAVLDLVDAIRSGTSPQAAGHEAFHVLDVMHAILESAENGLYISPVRLEQ